MALQSLPPHPHADGKSGKGSLSTKHYSCEGNVGDLFLKCERKKKYKKWVIVDHVMSSSPTAKDPVKISYLQPVQADISHKTVQFFSFLSILSGYRSVQE